MFDKKYGKFFLLFLSVQVYKSIGMFCKRFNLKGSLQHVPSRSLKTFCSPTRDRSPSRSGPISSSLLCGASPGAGRWGRRVTHHPLPLCGEHRILDPPSRSSAGFSFLLTHCFLLLLIYCSSERLSAKAQCCST